MQPLNYFGAALPNLFKISTAFLVRKYVVGISLGLLSCFAPVSAAAYKLNDSEAALLKRISNSSGQQRKTLRLDPILCSVARQRAADMVRRNYFSHTDPDGCGPNYLVRRAGYRLPSYYDRSRAGNNIESIGMASDPKQIFSMWMNSSAHRTHVLGTIDFYKQQTSIGVGVYRSPKAPYNQYFVFLSAPPSAATTP